MHRLGLLMPAAAILIRLEKPHRMDLLEAVFHLVDVNSVRSAVFGLLADANRRCCH
jgi:hypothetical protein